MSENLPYKNGEYMPMQTYDQNQMQELIECTKVNGTKIEALAVEVKVIAGQYNQIIKWLLIVVCTIALGSKAMEMANNIWGKTTITTAVAKSE